MIHSYSILSPLKLQNVTTPNKSLMSVCCVGVCRFGISFTYVTESIESKLISVCLINDYSLIANLHIFVYERCEFSSISLEWPKVKLSMLNNFGLWVKLFLNFLTPCIFYNPSLETHFIIFEKSKLSYFQHTSSRLF